MTLTTHLPGLGAASLTLVAALLTSAPATAQQSCCENGKPRVLTVRYTGGDCSASSNTQDPDKVNCAGDPGMAAEVRILSTDDEDPNASGASVWHDANVLLGDTYDIDATMAGETKLSSATFIYVYDLGGSLLQSIEFHTSCSQPLCIGDSFGSAEIVGCIGEDEPIPGDCCSDGRPRSLTMQYTGQGCDATNTTQDPDKYSCDGDPMGAPLVRILATNDADPMASNPRVWFDGEVALGDEAELSAANAGEGSFDSATFIYVFDVSGVLLQSVEFHTSCSQPLFVGDQFGSLLLTDCVSENEPIPGDCCDDGDLRQLSLQYTGEGCGATNTTQDPGKFSCDGDPMGEPLVRIRVSDDEDPNNTGADVYFDGQVALNDFFYPDAANAGQDKFSSATFVQIFDVGGNLLQSVEFHTSCSQPLFVGDQFGSLLLRGCLSDNQPPPPPFCVGEDITCPCGNELPGTGCENSLGGGGLLTSEGSSSVSNDDLRLTASGLPPNQFGLVFMGIGTTTGRLLGNGTRCVSAGDRKLFRFPVRTIDGNGVLREGPGLAEFALANFEQPIGAILPGDTWNFQTWYRDPGGPCGQTSNVSSAIAVTFSN